MHVNSADLSFNMIILSRGFHFRTNGLKSHHIIKTEVVFLRAYVILTRFTYPV